MSEAEQKAAAILREAAQRVDKARPVALGDTVRIKGTQSVGTVEAINGKIATVIFSGGMRSKLKSERLEHARKEAPAAVQPNTSVANQNALRGGLSNIAEALLADQGKVSRMTRETMDSHQKNFKHDLDVRGMRGDEALNAVQYYIDDAILVGVQQVRILHGKGNGILRQLIRQYLGTVPNVIRYHDEDIRFGGTGITVAEF